uniref:Uncharacterized protein n=1 Tax=Nelumbo nucifera TaxID=4432 RepID=A0A822ZW96_NELNU|nr:TPA_asm: hypothetical protein HUJ06_019104 [Nelumbo nucifera]
MADYKRKEICRCSLLLTVVDEALLRKEIWTTVAGRRDSPSVNVGCGRRRSSVVATAGRQSCCWSMKRKAGTWKGY